MSAFEAHSDRSGFFDAARSALKTFVNGIAHGRQVYRDYVHLSAMSDPELQDIGISRSDILAVVAGTYRRLSDRSLSRKQTPEGEENGR